MEKALISARKALDMSTEAHETERNDFKLQMSKAKAESQAHIEMLKDEIARVRTDSAKVAKGWEDEAKKIKELLDESILQGEDSSRQIKKMKDEQVVLRDTLDEKQRL